MLPQDGRYILEMNLKALKSIDYTPANFTEMLNNKIHFFILFYIKTMNIYQVLVLLIILLVILTVIYNQITNKENYVTNQHRIKYHVVPDFVPEINGKKYIKYLTNNQLLHGFTRGISNGFKADAFNFFK